MITYISLAVREYGEGRICISTDRMGGFWTAHGLNEKSMWRNVLEWTGKKFPTENINIAVIESYDIETLSYISNLSPTSYKKIDLQYISNGDLSKFDVLYFIGLPSLVSNDALSKIETYVREGGGILIENPNRGGENINILTSIENIYCSSSNRPIMSSAFWTETGTSHYIYSSGAKTYFYTTLELSAFSEDWDLLMSSAEVIQSSFRNPESETVIETFAHASSEFGIGYVCGFSKGVVILEEWPIESSSSSSSSSLDSSSSSSSLDSSSSSSSSSSL